MDDRYLMGANGGSMDRKWLREIHALELIIVAPWPLDAQFVSKYVFPNGLTHSPFGIVFHKTFVFVKIEFLSNHKLI